MERQIRRVGVWAAVAIALGVAWQSGRASSGPRPTMAQPVQVGALGPAPVGGGIAPAPAPAPVAPVPDAGGSDPTNVVGSPAVSAPPADGGLAGGGGQPVDPTVQPGPGAQPRAAIPAAGRGIMPLARLQAPQCTALAPQGWMVVGSRQDGQAMELATPQGGYAGWGILGVQGGMRQYYPQLRDPQSVVLSMLQGDGVNGARFTGPPQPFLNFLVVPVAGVGAYGPVNGFVLYSVYDGGPGAQPGSFIVSARIAIVLSQRPELLREAAAAALSIRCAAMVNLPSTGRGGAAGGESRGASTYNRQLGTEYYHDARTGENYLVDVTKGETDGPQGRGYYSCNGNWCTKLEAGRSDP